jgi:hypothetical protein
MDLALSNLAAGFGRQPFSRKAANKTSARATTFRRNEKERAMTALLSGCASSPNGGAESAADHPQTSPLTRDPRVPDASEQLEPVTAPGTCEHCNKPFPPRDANTGGQPKRFCSATCRKAANNSKRGQRLRQRINDGEQRLTLNLANNSTNPPTSQIGTPTTQATPPKQKSHYEEWEELKEDIVIQDQPKVAVYANARNQVVIRADGDGGSFSHDMWVIVSPPNLSALISRLQEFERGEE